MLNFFVIFVLNSQGDPTDIKELVMCFFPLTYFNLAHLDSNLQFFELIIHRVYRARSGKWEKRDIVYGFHDLLMNDFTKSP